MAAFNKFITRRIIAIPITLTLYGVIMLAPLDSRIQLYMPNSQGLDRNPDAYMRMRERIIEKYHLDESFPVQYFYWIQSVISGDWGYNPALGNDVLPELIRRTPVTLEIVIYSMLLQIPLGLISGVVAARRRERMPDMVFRTFAFIATSLPDFILAIVLMAIFYVSLGWFGPDRLSISNHLLIQTEDFILYTGMLTLDALLNLKPDIALDALRHLAMPVFTLSIVHWATLGRITRVIVIEEMVKDYITAARARGLSEKKVVWNHAFQNALGPALNSSALSATVLVTGVFIVERIFNFKGVSELITKFGSFVPDSAAVLGFGIYSVILVLIIMFVLDLLQTILVPQTREGIISNAE